MMVVLDVYSKNIKVKYKTFLLSKATFVVLVSGVMSIILPFILSYKSGGFWQKRDVVYEQPEVGFKGKYLLIATTTDNNHSPIICSSIDYYNKFLNHLDSCTVIKVRESDQNHDGKIDSIHIVLNVKLAQNTKISLLYFVLPLDYKLSTPCSFQMETAIIYQNVNINPSATKLSVFADLELEQMEPLVCPSFDLTSQYKKNIISHEKNIRSYELTEIIKKYSERHIKTSLKNIITTFNPTKDGTFTVSLNVNYPEHKIYFKPRFWQIVKFAWIQYLSLYIVISWMIFQIKRYIFDNNLVLLYKDRTNKNK